MKADVVIAAHDLIRWELTVRAIKSVIGQGSSLLASVTVVVDNNGPLFAVAEKEAPPGVRLLLHEGMKGASAARNKGASAGSAPLVAFLDDDACALPGWLEALTREFSSEDVVGVGGRIEPEWAGHEPRWFPRELAWTVGGTHVPRHSGPLHVRNVWSGNMAVRRRPFEMVGGFMEEFGKVGTLPLPEDTELCIRLTGATGGRWLLLPDAVVLHHVPPKRASMLYVLRRCYYEGSGKVALGRVNTMSRGLDSEREYLLRDIPRALRCYAFSGRCRNFAKGAVLALGIGAAGVGALRGLTARARWKDPGREVLRPHGPSGSIMARRCGVGWIDVSAPCDVICVDVGSPESLAGAVERWRRPSAFVVLRMGRSVVGTEVCTFAASGARRADMIREFSERVVQSTAKDGFGLADLATVTGPRPSVTVVICTRDNPEGLNRLLHSLKRQSDSGFSLIVVDNAPRDARTEAVVRLAGRELGARYLVEPVPGLSRGRNRGLAAVRSELVAWIDDDEVADEGWIQAVRETFGAISTLSAVSGPMLPAELEAEPQLVFEMFGGFNKGRSFRREVYRSFENGVHPLYPLPAVGVGGNMAFRVSALRDLGGFDVHLGAGTPAGGGEDTKIFTKLLLSGHKCAYEPSMVTWHYHRRSYEALERQLAGYGSGLTAYYASILYENPGRVKDLVCLVPRAIRDLSGGPNSARSGELPKSFPHYLLAASRGGMVRGPLRYCWSRWGLAPDRAHA